MPKPTFHNLPAAKRDRITTIAIDEFAEYPYAQASLSRIVARAEIAKGSIYQYFDSKLDLYRWLITEEVPRRKLDAMRTELEHVDPTDLRGFLRTMVLSGMRFMLRNPRLSQLASAVALPTADPALRQLYAEVRQAGLDGFKAMLVPARDRGQLRTDLDLDLIARHLSVTLTHGLRELALGQLGLDIFDLFTDPRRANTLSDAKLERLVDDTVSLVLEGVGPRSTQGRGATNGSHRHPA